jgi:hypothetical protein
MAAASGPPSVGREPESAALFPSTPSALALILPPGQPRTPAWHRALVNRCFEIGCICRSEFIRTNQSIGGINSALHRNRRSGYTLDSGTGPGGGRGLPRGSIKASAEGGLKTAKRFKASVQLREARRAAAMERGNPLPSPHRSKTIYDSFHFRHIEKRDSQPKQMTSTAPALRMTTS